MISNVMFWSDRRCFDRTMMTVEAKRIRMRGLSVYSRIPFTCKTCKSRNVIGLSSVNPVEKTEND